MPQGSSRIYVFRSPGGSGPGDIYRKLVIIIGIIIALFLLAGVLDNPGKMIEDLIEYVILIPIILISLSFHEFAHAAMADFLGDPTPRKSGRLSLNPLRHLDPVGTLMLLFTKFGWAKPVVVNPNNFRIPKRAMMSVALAGPLSNLLLALIGGGLMKLLYMYQTIVSYPTALLMKTTIDLFIIINIGLAVFNMIPLPPLDGSRVVSYFLPARYRSTYREIEAMGPLILLGLFMFGLIGGILGPAVRFGYEQILSLYSI